MAKRTKRVFARPPVQAARPPQVERPAQPDRIAPGGHPGGDGDIVLCPRDGLFLKDGREWGPAGAGWAHSLDWPAPSTVLGALRTACGREAEKRDRTPWGKTAWEDLAKVTTLGATVALRRPLALTPQGAPAGWTAAHRVWPVPADALFLNDDVGKHAKVLRLQPKKPVTPGLGSDDTSAREALWYPVVTDRGKPARPPIWWPDEIWTDWLANPLPHRIWRNPPENDLSWSDPLSGLARSRHVQVHVGIDRDTRTARDEILFAHDVVETLDDKRHEWAIGCQFASARKTDRPGSLASLGGDRRLAHIETARGLFAIPPSLAKAFDDRRPIGLRLFAVTPAAFPDGWCPPGFAPVNNEYRGRLPNIDSELILQAAMVPRAGHVSGWDMAKREPKRTTRLVPPGAVYHFAKVGGAAFTRAEAEKLWLVQLGERPGEGFGRFAPGLWNPKENGS